MTKAFPSADPNPEAEAEADANPEAEAEADPNPEADADPAVLTSKRRYGFEKGRK